MKEINKKLGKIKYSKLSMDKNIMSLNILVDYDDGLSQNIFARALDEWSDDHQTRLGTIYGCEIIRRLLELFEVNDLSDIKDKIVYITGTGNILSFNPTGIERLSFDGGKSINWEDVKKLSDELTKKEN